MLDENKAWLDLDVERMSQIKTILEDEEFGGPENTDPGLFLNNLSLTHLLMMRISLTILILSEQTEPTSLSILYENNKY